MRMIMPTRLTMSYLKFIYPCHDTWHNNHSVSMDTKHGGVHFIFSLIFVEDARPTLPPASPPVSPTTSGHLLRLRTLHLRGLPSLVPEGLCAYASHHKKSITKSITSYLVYVVVLPQ